MMQQRAISLSLVYPNDHGRSVRSERVSALADSMAAIGLRTPITVRPCKKMRDCAPIDAFEIVAGQHRYQAALKLKWTEIDCFVADESSLKTELWEIDENLMRAELSPAEEAAYLRRRKEIWEALTAGTNCSTSLGDGRKAGPQHVPSFASESAAKTGRTKQDINRSIRRAEQLGDDIERVKGTKLDKGVELDALVKMAPKEREKVIAAAERGENVSAREIVEKKSGPASKKSEAGSAEVSWTEDDEPTSQQLDAIRALDDAKLCEFLLRVEGVGLIAALKPFRRAAA